jgi:hypothetical protein
MLLFRASLNPGEFLPIPPCRPGREHTITLRWTGNSHGLSRQNLPDTTVSMITSYDHVEEGCIFEGTRAGLEFIGVSNRLNYCI